MEMMGAMKRYPRLTAHMICESLGYFTPKAAANAIAHYKAGKPFFCELYSHFAQFHNERGDMFDEESVLAVGKDFIKQTFARRHGHRGAMAEYKHAKKLVCASLSGEFDPTFASWF